MGHGLRLRERRARGCRATPVLESFSNCHCLLLPSCCMPKKPAWPLLVFAGVAAAVVGAASAAGFGAGASSAVMGQPLDFAVQVRLQAGEALAPECVSAEVTVGDRRVSPTLVRTALEMTSADTARIRVISSQAIDEPVVGVVLNAGCAAARLTRRFVVLADPPMTPMTPLPLAQTSAAAHAPTYAPAFAAALPTVGATGALAGAAPDDGGPGPAADTAGTFTTPAAIPATAIPVPAAALRNVASRTTASATPRAASRLAAGPRVRAEQRTEQPAEAPRRGRRAAVSRAAPVVAAAAPRLRLDVAEAPPSAQAAVVDQALAAVAQAASATRAATASASAAAERIANLERTVDGLSKQAQASRDSATQLRERLTLSEGAGRWTGPLLAVVLALVALAAWLAWRLNGGEGARQRAWAAAAAAAGTSSASANGQASNSELTPSKQATSPIPFVTSEIRLPPAAASARARATPAWPAPAPVDPPSTQAPPPDPPTLPLSRLAAARPNSNQPANQAASTQASTPVMARELPREASKDLPREPPIEFPYDTAMQRTEPMPPRLLTADESAPRDVSIEELIDLEQQAEFFIVLGQDDAAIELLAEHLRHTGGGSPLPYLKLLEVYRRRGDRDDYGRMRQRFNHRFNAYAPDWDADLLAGRTLETYGGVIPRLQQVWARPLDAMAELEALLFRKSRGDLFELPAYREVLFLYALARDLLDREAADTGNVDLLLPMADGGDFSSTAPAPFLGLDHDSGFDEQALDNRPTRPLDFDLTSERDRPSSIFGPLDGAVPRRR